MERAGGLWKTVARQVITSKRIRGEDDMKMLAVEINNHRNDNIRYGGYFFFKTKVD